MTGNGRVLGRILATAVAGAIAVAGCGAPGGDSNEPPSPGTELLEGDGSYGYGDGPPVGAVPIGPQPYPDDAGYLEETSGGWIGGDGSDSYYFDSESGCSVVAGEGVSC